MIHWRKNLFLVPIGKAGKVFVSELARLFQVYADCSSLEPVALEATTTMAILLIQKPHKKSKHHLLILERRLDLWNKGDIQSLLEESCCIQKHLLHVPFYHDN